MSSLRWIRNILVDGEKVTMEIVLGVDYLGHRCYAKINKDSEIWFECVSTERSEIIEKGKNVLKKALKGKSLTFGDGSPYNWQ